MGGKLELLPFTITSVINTYLSMFIYFLFIPYVQNIVEFKLTNHCLLLSHAAAYTLKSWCGL